MKIAVASEGKMVSEHFGHCAGFAIFTVRDNEIVDRVFVQNPGHKPGFLPVFLHDMDVNVVISGGMGAGAIEIFNEKQIQVVTGAQGAAEQTVTNYLSGQLQSSGSVCTEHQHADSCGGHHQ